MCSKKSAEFWESFVRGDHACFEDLFKTYYSGLYGYGLKLCFDSGLVEDSIQDLFVTIWERRNELDHIKSPNVYLYVSLRRNILKELKKKNSKRIVYDGLEGSTDIEYGIDELIIKDENKIETKKKLHKALNQLTNQQKEVIYLHFYNGMSYGEIEEILSINRQSVRNHVYKAMQTLREVLDLNVLRLIAMFPLLCSITDNINFLNENWKGF